MRPMLPILVLALCVLATPALPAADHFIRGGAFANWWTLGETVVFRLDEGQFPKGSPAGTIIDRRASAPLPEGTTAVVGTVRDSSGVQVAEVAVAAANFGEAGWSWTPARPGLYTVSFAARTTAGTSLPLTETYAAKRGWTPSQDDPTFTRDTHGFAVLPTRTRAPAEIPPQFDVHLSPPWSLAEFDAGNGDNQVREAALAGFHGVRIHADWDHLARTRGTTDWRTFDRLIERARAAGFQDFTANFTSTPRWASPHPERTRINICVPEYAAFAPARMEDWTGFLREAVRLHPEIRTWELWNEPSMPGMSCYWSDSPERYVELQKAGYQAVKAEQPGATVVLSSTHIAFYDRILELGAGQFFDVFTRHGQAWNGNEAFRQLERKYGVPSKPWFNGEWHAMLCGTGTMDAKTVPSEEALAFDLVMSFMNNLRLGAQKLVFFSMSNNYGLEQEMAESYRKDKLFFQTGGIFRRLPYPEPRLGAVVWRNLADSFSGSVAYRDGFQNADGTQSVALMESGAGRVLLLWTNTGEPVRIDATLAAAIGPQSQLVDWEGRTIAEGRGLVLQPARIYLVRRPLQGAEAAWTKAQVLRPLRYSKDPELTHLAHGLYREGRILDAELAPAATGSLAWQPLATWVGRSQPAPGAGVAARFALGFADGALELLVDVTDRVHHQPLASGAFWEGDSVQFSLDAQGRGRAEDRLDICAALTPQGPVLWKEHMPVVGGDLPGDVTLDRQVLKHGRMQATRTAGGTLYRIRIERADLFPFNHLAGHTLRFSILVNNNDGQGRTGYLAWAAGIGEGKDPALYGDLTVDAGTARVLTQADWLDRIVEGADAGQIEVVAQGEDAPFIRMISTAGPGKKGAIYSRKVAVVPGVAYDVAFQARGDVPLIVLVKVYDRDGNERRIDLGTHSVVPGTWSAFRQRLLVPPDCALASVWVLTWQRTGIFEAKELSVGAARP